MIRHHAVGELRRMIRTHIALAQQLVEWLSASGDFELLAPAPLNTICFRYKPLGIDDAEHLNRINNELLDRLNATGKMYLTHTKLRGVYALRMAIGQTRVEERHVSAAWELIQKMARAAPECGSAH